MGYPHKPHARESVVLSQYFGDPEAATLDGWKKRGGYVALQKALGMAPADIVTVGDASVILWNGGAGTVSTTYSLGDHRTKGDVVGSLSVDGPLDDATVGLRLAGDIDDPSPWWRLTHPLELFGLTD